MVVACFAACVGLTASFIANHKRDTGNDVACTDLAVGGLMLSFVGLLLAAMGSRRLFTCCCVTLLAAMLAFLVFATGVLLSGAVPAVLYAANIWTHDEFLKWSNCSANSRAMVQVMRGAFMCQ